MIRSRHRAAAAQQVWRSETNAKPKEDYKNVGAATGAKQRQLRKCAVFDMCFFRAK